MSLSNFTSIIHTIISDPISSAEILSETFTNNQSLLADIKKGNSRLNLYQSLIDRESYFFYRFPETSYLFMKVYETFLLYLESGFDKKHFPRYFNVEMNYHEVLDEWKAVRGVKVVSLGGACGPEILGLVESGRFSEIDYVSIDKNDWGDLLSSVTRYVEGLEDLRVRTEFIKMDICSPEEEVLLSCVTENIDENRLPLIITASFFFNERQKKNIFGKPRFGKTLERVLVHAPIGSLFIICDGDRFGADVAKDIALFHGFSALYEYQHSVSAEIVSEEDIDRMIRTEMEQHAHEHSHGEVGDHPLHPGIYSHGHSHGHNHGEHHDDQSHGEHPEESNGVDDSQLERFSPSPDTHYHSKYQDFVYPDLEESVAVQDMYILVLYKSFDPQKGFVHRDSVDYD